MLIPFIKDAIGKTETPIQIMASPWSPPAWMKTNGQMNHGGKLKEEFRDVWAIYYCKYIKAYEKEGGTWASGGRAEGGLMTKGKKKK